MRFNTTSKRSSPEENRILQTIPGVNENCAATILAEIGPTITAFPSDAHLASWAGLCPGSYESAGIKKILTYHARKSIYQAGFDHVGIDCGSL